MKPHKWHHANMCDGGCVCTHSRTACWRCFCFSQSFTVFTAVRKSRKPRCIAQFMVCSLTDSEGLNGGKKSAKREKVSCVYWERNIKTIVRNDIEFFHHIPDLSICVWCQTPIDIPATNHILLRCLAIFAFFDSCWQLWIHRLFALC